MNDKLADLLDDLKKEFFERWTNNLKKIGIVSSIIEKLEQMAENDRDEAIVTIIESIQSIEDEKERHKIGVYVFGTIWEDFFAKGSGSDA